MEPPLLQEDEKKSKEVSANTLLMMSQNTTQEVAGPNQQNTPEQPESPNVHLQALPTSDNSSDPVHCEFIQQFLQTSRLPSCPEKQNQILQVSKSNPQLMAMFIKQRLLQLQKQKEQDGQSGCGLQGPPALFSMAMQVLPTSGIYSNQLPHDQSLDELMQMLQLSDCLQQQDHLELHRHQQHDQLQQLPALQRQDDPLYRQGTLHIFNVGMQALPMPDNALNHLNYCRVLQQRLLQRSPSSISPQLGDLPGPQEPSASLPTSGNSSDSRRRQALQQLLPTFRLPSCPEKLDEILKILKAHPQLMGAFRKSKQLQNQRQHVQRRRHL